MTKSLELCPVWFGGEWREKLHVAHARRGHVENSVRGVIEGAFGCAGERCMAGFDGVVPVQRLERFVLRRPAHAGQGKRAVFHATKGDDEPLVQFWRRGRVAYGSKEMISLTPGFSQVWSQRRMFSRFNGFPCAE